MPNFSSFSCLQLYYFVKEEVKLHVELNYCIRANPPFHSISSGSFGIHPKNEKLKAQQINVFCNSSADHFCINAYFLVKYL